MKLSLLLRNFSDYQIYGNKNVTVGSLSGDSRNVKRNGLFVAIKGLTVDGHDYISQAIDNGAKVLFGEMKPKKAWLEKITYVQIKDTRSVLGILASTWYDNPSEKLKVIGVTGTKGKTTTVHMIHHVLNSLGKNAGMISSITYPGLHVTTPGSVEIHKILKSMASQRKKYAVIEVSSHAIDQKRIAGVEFEVGVLTNISPEHLDYHKNLKRYKETKMSFIKSVRKRIICPKTTKLNICTGKFNNLNAEAAVLVVGILGIKRKDALGALSSFKLPKGRLEEIKNKKGFRIFVDFAHSPDSLREVLSYLKSITKGNLIAVLGCAGERDVNKRSVMGEISVKLADISVFTAEDPRSEDVNYIVEQIISGAKKVTHTKELKLHNYRVTVCGSNEKYKYYFRILERGEAISFAIQKIAKNKDTIVICGKGHEKSMAYEGVEYPWSDQEAVKVALKDGVKMIERHNL